MRTALNLLNKIVDLGYDQQKTLMQIDKILDKKLGIEGVNRCPTKSCPTRSMMIYWGFSSRSRKNQ